MWNTSRCGRGDREMEGGVKGTWRNRHIRIRVISGDAFSSAWGIRLWHHCTRVLWDSEHAWHCITTGGITLALTWRFWFGNQPTTWVERITCEIECESLPFESVHFCDFKGSNIGAGCLLNGKAWRLTVASWDWNYSPSHRQRQVLYSCQSRVISCSIVTFVSSLVGRHVEQRWNPGQPGFSKDLSFPPWPRWNKGKPIPEKLAAQ